MVQLPAGYGQQAKNSKDLLQNSLSDTNAVNLFLQQAELYYFSNPDSCLILAEQAIELSRKLNFQNGEFKGLSTAGEALRFLGEFPKALEMQFQALQLSRHIRDKGSEAATMSFIGVIYVELNEYRQALNYFSQAKNMYDNLSDAVMQTFNLSNIGNAYEKMNMLDSALHFQQQASVSSFEVAHKNLRILIMTRLGIIYTRLGNHKEALEYSYNALQNAYLIGDEVSTSRIQILIAELFLTLNLKDSSLHYARLAFATGKHVSQKLQILQASNLLAKLFRDKMPDSVIYYQDIAITMNNSLYGSEKFRQLQLLTLKEQEQQQQILKEKEQNTTKTRMFALLIMLALFLIIALLLFRNNRHKQKVNLQLEEQKNEIQETLTILKSTQNQLVLREKMASLGELTSGIAHEIQNPLNFVNNFSEVNTELLTEMKDELEKGNIDEVKAITNNVIDNEQKITHHGKRADAIVKGMLQHSSSSSGVKEPTDINTLCEEYLRLSYHGLRAKDKSFNANLKTDFDQGIFKIEVVPQDIGRVLLNLYNNAFYSVNEKKKQMNGTFEPAVEVSTKRSGNKIEIIVKDNGTGIPQKIVDKIYQPFFTTKPTGQGTGLGLSLSFDIIKAHGGELSVQAKEGEFAEFKIVLPITT
jgi:signal transduction histidine kinase